MKKNDLTVQEHLLKAEQLMDNKLYDRSMIEFNKVLKIDRHAVGQAFDRIYKRCLSEGNYDGLIAIGSNLLLKQPQNVEMANLLGNAYRRIGDNTQAEKLYEHALKHDPNNRLAAYNLAATMAHSNLYDNSVISAISAFENMKGYKLPDNKEGEKQLLAIQKKINESQEKEQAEEAPPTTSTEPAQSEENLEAQSPSETPPSETSLDSEPLMPLEPLEEIAPLEPKAQPRPKENRQEAKIVPRELFQYIQFDQQFQPEEKVNLIQSLGIYCLEQRIFGIAWRALARAAFMKPEDKDLQGFLALAQAIQKKEKPMIEKLVSFLGKYPYNRYANVNLGYLYWKQGNRLLARKYFIIAKELLTKSEDNYDMLAFRALGDQNYEEQSYLRALQIYQVIQSENETAELLHRMGIAYIKLEKYGEALDCFYQIEKNSPNNPNVQKIFKHLNQVFLQKAEDFLEERKFSKAWEFLEFSERIEKKTSTIERMIVVAQLLKDDKKIRFLNEQLNILRTEEAAQEKENHRQQLLKEAKHFAAHRQFRRAIQSYEAAFRLKADKEVFVKLASLYKKTKQMDMVADLTQRFNKLVELENRLAQYEKDLERKKRLETEEIETSE